MNRAFTPKTVDASSVPLNVPELDLVVVIVSPAADAQVVFRHSHNHGPALRHGHRLPQHLLRLHLHLHKVDLFFSF